MPEARAFVAACVGECRQRDCLAAVLALKHNAASTLGVLPLMYGHKDLLLFVIAVIQLVLSSTYLSHQFVKYQPDHTS